MVSFFMTEQELAVFYFLVRPWIAGQIAEHARSARSVASMGFPRLSSFYSAPLLISTKAVIVSRVPVPPLRAMGLAKVAAFEDLNPCAVCYPEIIFIKQDCQNDEAVYFHELVHVIQWRLLGPDRFLRAYVQGLRQVGYRAQDYQKSPLEMMAYGLQARFEEGATGFDVEAEVTGQLKAFDLIST